MDYINVKALGATGDGSSDDSAAFNAAIQNNENIYIPDGTYMIGSTVLLTSHTHIIASPLAHIKLMAGAQKGRYDFLLKNADNERGNTDISITGGIWDGNCGENDRGTDLFNPDAVTGSLFSFRKVSGLTLKSLTLKNPLCYYMRFCEAENVGIDCIRFDSDVIAGNQDGIHLAGYCRNFIIRNLWGAYGSPNDDFIAFNADDCLTRQENSDMINGPIDNVLVENVYSEFCHCFVRLLCVDSTISNVTVRNVSGACKQTAVNMDCARYCRVPLFKDTDKPNGAGNIENVLIENMAVSNSNNDNDEYITLETNCTSFTVRNFTGLSPNSPFASIRKTCKHSISFGGTERMPDIPDTVSYDSCIKIKSPCVPFFEFRRIQEDN